MSQFIPPIEVSDQTFNAIQRQAETIGTSPSLLIAASLEQQFGSAKLGLPEIERQAARERFERHFGEVDLGRATGVDNQGIDHDLVKEYISIHEGL